MASRGTIHIFLRRTNLQARLPDMNWAEIAPCGVIIKTSNEFRINGKRSVREHFIPVAEPRPAKIEIAQPLDYAGALAAAG